MTFRHIKKMMQAIVLLLIVVSCGGCELVIFSLSDMSPLNDQEKQLVANAVAQEAGLFIIPQAEFNEEANKQAKENIIRNPDFYLSDSKLGLNSDQLSRSTYPGIFCGTGANVSAANRGGAISQQSLDSINAGLGGNASLAQILSFCGF